MFRTLDDLECDGRRVLVRGDLNVPTENGKVTDVTRLERLAPTLAELAERGCRIVVISHFGRPKGKPDPAMSLAPVADALAAVLGVPVAFAADCIGSEAAAAVEALAPGGIALLENLRYHPGEEENDRRFTTELAKLADFYVNDAFSVSHRAHASTTGIAQLLPSAAGRGMQAELEALASALGNPAHPLAAIVAGAKISTKLEVLGNLIDKVDSLVIGGAMANTFLHALGTDIGASLAEKDLADSVKDIMARADAAGCAIVLPSDVAIATQLEEGAAVEVVPIAAVPPDKMILDIGPETVEALRRHLAECRTLLWNGPLGAFEVPPFNRATVAVAEEAARLTEAGKLVSVAGGGDTVAALNDAGVLEQFSYVSTAGGAFLEWLEGKELPGVAALGGDWSR
ncbi:MAG: phosphoglycerate kinase [Alphaproteobacteria bacterium]|jgi:phosphoglycerate kinase|nr:phosphoglycerate kinase [Alphaproteobacteria bacterium]